MRADRRPHEASPCTPLALLCERLRGLPESARGQELAQVLFVLVAGEPGLSAVRRVQFRIVPEQLVLRRFGAALRRADRGGIVGGHTVSERRRQEWRRSE